VKINLGFEEESDGDTDGGDVTGSSRDEGDGDDSDDDSFVVDDEPKKPKKREKTKKGKDPAPPMEVEENIVDDADINAALHGLVGANAGDGGGT